MSFFGRSKKKTAPSKEPHYESVEGRTSGSFGGQGGSLAASDQGSLSRAPSKGSLKTIKAQEALQKSLSKGSLSKSMSKHMSKESLKSAAMTSSGSLKLGGAMHNVDMAAFAPSMVVRSRQDPEFRRYLTQLITGPNGTAKAAEEYEESCPHELGFKVGEEIQILGYTDDPKWAMGRNASGRKGLVPVGHFDKAAGAAQDSMQMYWGLISKKKAEAMLAQEPCEDGKFLIRDAKNNGEHILSVVFSDEDGERQFAHYRIAKDEMGMHYVSESKKFTSVRQLIDFYNNQQSGLVARLGIWFKGNQSKATKKGGLHAALERTEVKTEAEIGKGHFGKVYKGSYQGKETAVKILCNRSAENAVIELGGQLASLSHPNIVKYYGYVQDEIIWVVMDFCVYGSLKGLVLKEKEQYPVKKLSQYMQSTADGMSYLESEKVIHRNLRMASLLIDIYGKLKISDYGWATPTDIKKGIRYPIKWTAPEAFSEQKFDSRSDVWSFGVVIYEVFSYGKEPYEGMSATDIFTEVYENGSRLDPPSGCPSPWKELMPKCFALDPAKRPTFSSFGTGAGED